MRSRPKSHAKRDLTVATDRSYAAGDMSSRSQVTERSAGGRPPTRGRHGSPTRRGAETRDAILFGAVGLASIEGLEGLTLGVLADRLGLSKSGLYAHFGSKAELQLATFARARETFVEEAMRPAFSEPRGLPRVWGLVLSFLSYLDRAVFAGGCFISGAVAEFDTRSGPVHDAVVEAMADWRWSMVRAVEAAVEAGHLVPETDASQLGFELCAILQGTNFQHQILSDPQVLDRCARAVRERLSTLTTESAPKMLIAKLSSPSGGRRDHDLRGDRGARPEQ